MAKVKREDIERKVNEVLNEQPFLDVEGLNGETKLVEDLGADSLDAVEIIMELEKEFGIRIEDEDADKCKTVGDVYELVERLTKV